MIRHTKANGEGRFTFNNLADGRYHIATNVVWKVGDIWQGGPIKVTVNIIKGEPIDVVMNGS